MDYKLLDISVFWAAGTEWRSRRIKGLEHSEFSHCGLQFTFPNVTILGESLDHGVEWTPREHIDRAIEAGKVSLYYTTKLNTHPPQRSDLYRKALTLHGEGYDWGQLFIYLAWVKLWKRKHSDFLAKLSAKSNKLTCNEFVVKTCYGLAPEFADADWTWTPEGMFKHLHDGVGSIKYLAEHPPPTA